MATQINPEELNLEGQLVRIRKMIAESDRIADERQKKNAEITKLSVDARLAPWQLALGGVTSGAALFAAAAAFTKLFL
jgi:hypothetical protein